MENRQQSIVETQEEFDIQDVNEDLEYKDRESQTMLTELGVSERRDILAMRKLWARVFIGVIVVILVFEIGITVAVGMGKLYFADEWFLRIIILGGIAQILAMPYLVTQFLFRHETSFPSSEKPS